MSKNAILRQYLAYQYAANYDDMRAVITDSCA